MNRHVSKTHLICLLILCAASNIFAQLPKTPGTAPGTPAGSTQLSDIDTINYYSGRLNVSIPITNLGGRGEAQFPFSIQLEQNSWQQDFIVEPSTGNYHYYPVRKSNGEDAVFSDTTGPAMKRLSLGYGDAECNGYHHAVRTLTLLQFIAPNGTTYEFRDAAWGGRINTPNVCGSLGDYVNRGTVFTTNDGSSATFVSDSVIVDSQFPATDNPGPLNGYLYLRDGTKYRFEDGGAKWMRDRNGNLLTFTQTTTGLKITDAIGRTLQYNVRTLLPTEPYTDTYDYKGFQGASRSVQVRHDHMSSALRNGEETKSYAQLFPHLNFSPDSNYNPYVITKIVLPNLQEYRLYYNSYGDLARIELPTGGAIEYDWGGAASGGNPEGDCGCSDAGEIHRRMVERRVYADGTNLTQRMVVGKVTNSTDANAQITVDLYGSSSSTLMSRINHFFYGNPLDSPNPYYFYSWWKSGKEYQTQMIDTDGTTLLRQINQTWAPRAYLQGFDGGPGTEPAIDPRVIETTTQLTDVSPYLVSKTTSIDPYDQNHIGFDEFNNPTDVWQYDYGSGSTGAFLRHEHTDYVTSNTYTNRLGVHLLSLPSQHWVSTDPGPGAQSRASLVRYEYDNYSNDYGHYPLTPRAGVFGHETAVFGISNTARGNVTALTSFENSASETGPVSTYVQYDILGNAVKTIDARNQATSISYDDNFGVPDAGIGTGDDQSYATQVGERLSNLSTFAYPTSTTNPLNWTSHGQYDYFTGQAINTQDINGVVSKTSSTDPLDRPTQTVTAVNSPLARQTTVNYSDATHTVQTTSDLNTLNDNLIKSVTITDGLGRTKESRDFESNVSYRAIQTQYDALGRPNSRSNPFRPTDPIAWTTTKYDSLGRAYETETPDGAKVKTAYAGNRVLVTDQALKQRMSRTDALGQLKDIWEVTASDPDTQSISFPGSSVSAGYHTSYTYDVSGNLTNVSQGGQTRSFTYNSLSRLVSAQNPESGTISYTYDPAGNLKTKRDARNTKTIYDYDELSRVIKRCYKSIGPGSLGLITCQGNSEMAEPNTPDVTFTYGTVAPAIGKLVKVDSSVSTTEYTSFDILGRVTASKQTTDGELTKTYSYKDGKLIGVVYQFFDLKNQTNSLKKRFEYHELNQKP